MSESGKRLHEIFYRKGNPVVHMSAPTPYGARMLEFAGFEYIFLGGDVTFGTMLGKAGQYLTVTEKTFVAKYFIDSVSLPVLMDCDEIIGQGPAWAERCAYEYIRTGIGGMDIDDREPQHAAGRSKSEREEGISGVIPVEDMVDKIKAIVEVKKALDPDFMLRVRAYGLHCGASVDETIERLHAFEAAGAEMFHISGITRDTVDVLRRCVQAVGIPCTTPAAWLTYDDAKELGLAEVRYPYELEMTMHASGWEFLQDFRKRGYQAITENRAKFKDNPYMARTTGALYAKQGNLMPRATTST